jgi:integrase
VFPSTHEKSRPFDPRSVTRRADTAWKAEGLLGERTILHLGRHTAASSFIAAKLDSVRVAKWLGHSDSSTTLRVYAKAFEAREKHDLEKVEAFYAQQAERLERGPVAGQ